MTTGVQLVPLLGGLMLLFFEMRESMDEIRAMASRFKDRASLLFNHSVSGMVPRLPVPEIEALGFKAVSFPVHALFAACKTMREVLTEIKRTGNTLSILDRLIGFEEFWEIGDLSEIRKLEKKYGV